MTKIRKIAIKDLMTPNNFAGKKGVSRQMIYQLIKKELVDSVVIDGTIFVLLTEKSKNYKKIP